MFLTTRTDANQATKISTQNPVKSILRRTLLASSVSFGVLSLMLAGFSTAQAKVEYDATTLQLKNSDQVNDMMKVKIKKAQSLQAKQDDNEDGEIQAEPEAVENLKDALRIALARPDQPEGSRANLYGRVRRELTDLNALDQVLTELTEESLAELRTQDGPRRTATYVVILENMMAEMRPELVDNSTYRKIVERVRDAKITITDKSKVQNLLRSMSIPMSPSDTAAKLLSKLPPSPAAPVKKKK